MSDLKGSQSVARYPYCNERRSVSCKRDGLLEKLELGEEARVAAIVSALQAGKGNVNGTRTSRGPGRELGDRVIGDTMDSDLEGVPHGRP
jgi:hypothetical protein